MSTFSSDVDENSGELGRPMLPPAEQTILEILDDRALRLPDRRIFTYLDEGEFETETLTYAELQQRAQAIAAELQKHTTPGDRALLIYPPGLEVIAALFGCFYAGVIAVPCSPPRLDFLEDGLAPLAGIAADCDPAVILTGGVVAESLPNATAHRAEFRRRHVLISELIPSTQCSDFSGSTVGRDALAVLQYTSGSTGDPKGVMVTHGNILHNSFALQIALEHRPLPSPGRGAGWLPYYHDMGLIADIIQPVYADGPSYHFSPLMLLQRPIRWLEIISRYRIHSSAGPNFAYDLCVRRVTDEQKKSLDLSCWEAAAIGAEPISHQTIEQFSQAFASCGFREEAFYPCYGLAEATLIVSGGDKSSPPVTRAFRPEELEYRNVLPSQRETSTFSATESANAERRILVGCGRAVTDHEIVIADPETCRPCSPGCVGEIWFQGPSVAKGYWGRAEETQDTFDAYLKDSRRGPFLRTGDLGVIRDGELYVCGRIKDLIVVRGQNHYPQDIEATVGEVSEVFPSQGGAAVSHLVEGEEQLIVLQEIDRRSRKLDLTVLRKDVRRRVAERHQLSVQEVVFLQKGSLPKTTSGKVRRQEALHRHLAGRLMNWKPKDRT